MTLIHEYGVNKVEVDGDVKKKNKEKKFELLGNQVGLLEEASHV
jgi:hypothetical protein